MRKRYRKLCYKGLFSFMILFLLLFSAISMGACSIPQREQEEEETQAKRSKKKKKQKARQEEETEEESEETVAEETEETSEETTVIVESTTVQPPPPTQPAALPSERNTDLLTTLYVVNCNESITLRSSPSTKASGIRQIPLGSAVSYIETSTDGFYKVSYMGDTGYALASYLSTSFANHVPPQTTAGSYSGYTTLYVVNCNEFITLRSSPSTKASEIRKIPLGSAVSYIEDSSNGFYKVNYLGDTGYALASYLSTSFANHVPPQTEPGAADPKYAVVVNCRESITLRTSPSTSASEILQIPLGAVVWVYGDAGNGFYDVEYQGYYGYALKSYISLQ